MTELGKRLKEAREEKGITLDDLQEITKIQKRYLAGIEQGNYSMIPGKFYVRAFIKQYAEAVGIQPEVIFDEYKDEIPSVYDEELPEKLSRVQTRKNVSHQSSKFFEIIPKLLMGVFAIGVVALIWFIFQKYAGDQDASQKVDTETKSEVDFDQSEDSLTKDKDDQKDKNDETNSGNDDENTEKDNNQEETPEEEPPVSEAELKVVGTQGTTTTYELLNAETFELKISVPVDEEAWLDIKNGANKVLYSGMLSDGADQTYDLSNDQSVTITTGRSISTEIFVNGQKLEYALDPEKNFVQNIVIKYNKNNE